MVAFGMSAEQLEKIGEKILTATDAEQRALGAVEIAMQIRGIDDKYFTHADLLAIVRAVVKSVGENP